MTNPTLTIESGSNRKHRFVVVDQPGIKKLNLDAFITNKPERANVFADLTFAQAHEIADFIKAHVPAPKPVHRDWDSIPVGASFGFYDAPEDVTPSSRFPYTKLSETSYNHVSPSFNNDYTRNHPVPPSSQRLIVKPAPTIRAQVDELATGTQFTVPHSGGHVFTKLTKGKIWSTFDNGTLVDLETHVGSWSHNRDEISVVSAA
jgi:hypothetical protein